MKILVVHNAYRQPGGEDAVAQAEVELLRANGHDVEFVRLSNTAIDDMPRPALAAATIWNPASRHDIGQLCERFVPDIIHAHNTFPLVSPSLYWMAAQQRVPVVQTLHNFRLICPQAMLLKHGELCEACVGHLPWRAVTNRCYHDSAVESAVICAMVAVHRAIGTYRRKVTSYIAPSRFCKDKHVAGGFAADSIHVKPNFVAASGEPDWRNRHHGLFVGRLSNEKGLRVLAEALIRMRHRRHPIPEARIPKVQVIGGGPLEVHVAEEFKEDYLGRMTRAEVLGHLHKAQFAVVPSICYETFGLAAAEAFSCGTPVIASNHGGIGELIEDGKTGLLFAPGDAHELSYKIEWAADHPEEMVRMGQEAYRRYLEKYTPQRNYVMLREIYDNAISAAGRTRHA
ncbi:MAG TPA: glycosyltransferase [Burkholderiaceae bacterium]